ncbi:histidine kinase dimerization/phospho-acceptor domain-containing protein, partial [Vibrio parahaemolyticus]|nr:histidine kinase dimerization/phospho-acceptor domain-containing protein [Vibrio parahaemolyticus]
LPFFFFYMLLMNDWSNVWVMSFMSAIFLHILLVHVTRVMFAQTFAGIGLATFFAWVAKGFHLDLTMDWTHVPIFLFIYVFGNLFYFRNQVEHEAKVSLAKSFGAGLAHEMRNPLAQVQLQFEALKQHIESNASLDMLKREIDNGEAAIQRGRQLIDIILREVSDSSPEHEPLALTSIHKAI